MCADTMSPVKAFSCAALLCAAGCLGSPLDAESATSGEGATAADAAAHDADRGDEPGPDAGASGAAGMREQGPPDLSKLTACNTRRVLAGACVRILEGSGDFSNCSPPLVGTIVAMGPDQARPECFGSDNWGRAIPNSAPAGQAPIVPEDTQWFRVDDGMQNLWTIAVAAPGLADIGIAVGDQISFKHGVGFSGFSWSSGNAQIEFQGRGRVVLAISDSSLVRVVGEGPAACSRRGECPGYEWAMRVEIEGAEVTVAPGASVAVGGSLLTNALAFTDGPGYDPDAGGAACGAKVEFVAALVSGP